MAKHCQNSEVRVRFQVSTSQCPDFKHHLKDVVISTLFGSCSNAAFSECLDVMATATNGYGTLTGCNAAFALATPCPDCDKGGNP